MKAVKYFVAGMGALLMASCAGGKQKTGSEGGCPEDTLVLCMGSYASAEKEGVQVYLFNQHTGEASYVSGIAGISNPSFLTASADGTRVYVVAEDEGETASVHALRFDKASRKLFAVDAQPTRGGAPCHIALSPREDYVLTANYLGGNITVFPLDGEGKPGAGDTLNFTGCGPDKERQTQPHLHCVTFTPDGKYLLANDLGTDRIHAFPLAAEGGEQLLDRASAFDIQLPEGCGPRHLCFASNGKFAYLITELSGEVVAFSYTGSRLEPIQRIKADTLGAKGSADIHLSPDGKFLYVSNRLKGDGIAIFRVDPASGCLEKVGYRLTGGHPRNFILTPNGEYLLVACRDADEVQVYKRNPENGLLEDTGARIKMEKPVCLRFIAG